MEFEDGQGLPQLSSRVVNTDEPIIAVMRAVVAEASSSSSSSSSGTTGPVASLAQGAVWWQPPAVALEAAADAALRDPVSSSSYSDDMGLPELRAAVLRKCEQDHGLRAAEHAAMVSAGANLAVSALALALLDSSSSASSLESGGSGGNEARKRRKDAAVLFPPYYFNAKMAVQLAGAEVVLGKSDAETWLPDVDWLEARLREEDEEEGSGDEQHEGAAAAAAAAGDDENASGKSTRIRMVYLVNPGNPSGVVVPFELVRRLADVCSGRARRSRRAVFLVLDSTYEAFAPAPPEKTSSSTPRPPPFPLPSAPHVIHVGSFSKAFGAAGWRVGYVVYPLIRARHEESHESEKACPSPVVVDLLGPQLLKIQDTLPIHAAVASQRLALACLEGAAAAAGGGGGGGGGKRERGGGGAGAGAGAGGGAGEEGEDGADPRAPLPPAPSPSFGRAWVSEKVAGLASSKKAAEVALANLGPSSKVWGEGAIYLWARLPPPAPTTDGGGGGGGETAPEAAAADDDREFVRFCVSRHGVAVIPGSACGVPGCVRVAYGRPAPGPEFEEAAARLARACREWVARN